MSQCNGDEGMAKIIRLQRRIWMTISGIFLAGISVGMFYHSDFGMDPFQVFAHGVWKQTTLSYGFLYTVLNLIMLVGVFLTDRKKIGLGTVFNIFLVGYIVEFSSGILEYILPDPTLIQRILLLILAVIFMCFGSSLYFTADLGVSTYDAVALILAERTPVPFKFCRLGSDLICTIIGFILGATVGMGTLITAFFMGPLISYFNHKIAIPLRYRKSIHNVANQ